MAIILKNNLNGKVTFATNVPSGSGYIEGNGASAIMPEGTTKISWTVEKDAAAGSFETNASIMAQDRYVYIIGVSKEAI